MSKLSVTLIYISIAIFLLLLVSRTPKNKSSSHRSHRRLKIRSNFTFSDEKRERIPFDPLIADMERRREEHQWEKHYFEQNHKEFASNSENTAPGFESQPEWEDVMDAEDYLNDEDRFNITGRLVLLFPNIDVDPRDGFVTVDELTEWNMKQAEKEAVHRIDRDMEVHDKNHDGVVSFHEYDPPAWARRSSDNFHGDDIGWWKEDHFNSSDIDGNGLLNWTEFKDFLHPADSKNPKLLRWLCKEEIRERDSDKDGKLNFQEFFRGLFDSIRTYDDNVYNSSHVGDDSEVPAKILFAGFDQDKDGYLSEEELLPIVGKLHPSERYYSKQQAEYVITQADADKDGRLSLQEMIDNPYVFYTAIFSDEDDYHDEFR